MSSYINKFMYLFTTMERASDKNFTNQFRKDVGIRAPWSIAEAKTPGSLVAKPKAARSRLIWEAFLEGAPGVVLKFLRNTNI